METKNEVWKDIRGFEGRYQVSNMGRVRSLDRDLGDNTGRFHPFKGELINAYPNKQGYLRVRLRDGKGNRKHFRVNRLVALHFCPGFKEGLDVNHINEIKTDNRAENLEWCTRKQNINHGTWRLKCHGRHSTQGIIKGVEQLKGDVLIATYKSVKEASEKTGINKFTIYSACSGRHKSAAGFKWRYLI